MNGSTNPGRTRLWLGLAAALAVAAFLAPLASHKPDGLDRVAEDHGLTGKAIPRAGAPLAGYRLPGVRQPGLGTAIAGVAGTLLTFGAGWGLTLVLRLRRRQPPDDPARLEAWKPL